MVGSEETSASYTMSTVSYDTALCVLPPVEQCEHVDSLRELYDKSFGRWPAHVNLVYPFVATECLPQAQQQIQAHFDKNINADTTRKVKLDSAALFKQRHNSTAIVQESPASSGRNLETLRSLALQALGRKSTPHNFHLTIGQTEDNSMSSLELLLSKTRYLPAINFEIGSLAILIRERTPGEQSANRMRLWGVIELAPSWAASTSTISEYWLKDTPTISTSEDQDDDEDGCSMSPTAFSRAAQPGKTFFFDQKKNKWVVTATTNQDNSEPSSLTVSSYNVLVDSEYPPERDRDPLLISTLLSSSAKADILVLQEVSDDFLATLLENANVQSEYPFTSHAPPTQSDIGPLPSLRNIVILSKYPFRWELVPFHRRHKGAVVAVFDSFVRGESLVVAGIHLTCGLTDGSVAAKKTQVQSLLRHLTQQYTDQPWVIAGDFNIVTSAYTIETALKNQSISSQTSVTLSNIESMLAGDGLLDAWSVAQVEHSIESYEVADELFDGEEGATFDPRNNLLATETSGTSQNRPQRYDRILIRPQETLRVVHFNMFGLPEDINGVNVVPSDHSGIRTSLQLLQHTEQLSLDHLEMLESLKMEPQHIPHLQNQALESVLSGHGMFLGVEEKSKRKAAFDLLKSVVLGTSHSVDISTAEIPMVMVTVGSYAMKVDTLHSDIDCLCIGTISSKTFFKLARQRLQKAESQGIRILRKVEASTGTMLELSVNGIPMDLQYCPAARIVERWSEFQNLPASDPIFNLSILSLRKLKPYRDLLYIRRTLPSLETFGLAYRAIKLWATQRGVYSSKFGFLGGIHITLMLSWVYKRVSHEINAQGTHSVSADDLVATFFHYYADFDWTGNMVYDAFFHKQKPRYHRTAREPMVVLGFHAPNSNVAHTSTIPGLQILAKEFRIACQRLLEPGVTWTDFFKAPTVSGLTNTRLGETQFLQSYSTYVKIDIQFWGRTLSKGKGLVGWVESRSLSLVVDINKVLPNFEIRIWPTRFTDTESDCSGGNTDYHGCYLIGLSRNAELAASNNQEERQLSKQSLEKVLDRFLSQLRTDEKNYDAGTCWVNVSLAKSREVQGLRLDDREWGDYIVEIEPDSDDEEEPDDTDEEQTNSSKFPMRSKPVSTLTPVSSSKLRPASDVINRLRWDPNLDPADYIIGYEDRFLGAKETSLEKWKTEQTDEEFIPQHRILYFRRKFNEEGDGKGEIVWERATRVDKVFGSGISAQS